MFAKIFSVLSMELLQGDAHFELKTNKQTKTFLEISLNKGGILKIL